MVQAPVLFPLSGLLAVMFRTPYGVGFVFYPWPGAPNSRPGYVIVKVRRQRINGRWNGY